jgi:hypothetical protein
MKIKKSGKKNQTIAKKRINQNNIQPISAGQFNNSELEYINSENERLGSLNRLLDRLFKESIENYLLNEFEASDIRFLINDYLTAHSISEIPDYYIPNEDETNDDF